MSSPEQGENRIGKLHEKAKKDDHAITDEEIIDSMLESDFYLEMAPVKKYKKKMKIVRRRKGAL